MLQTRNICITSVKCLLLPKNCSSHPFHPQLTPLFEWWLCVHWKALYVSASQWIREVLWSILPAAYEGFPFLLSRSRRWDHRTSLHRWQLRLKVSRSRGAYRLLARCEILPRMLCPACARSFITQRDGMSLLPTKKESLQFGVLLSGFISFFISD